MTDKNENTAPQVEVVDLSREQFMEKVKQAHIYFAMPCYGGQVTEGTFTSFIRFTIDAMRHGLNFSLDTMVNESLITRGRNNLVAKFLENKSATHLMFVDADIRFDPESIFRMVVQDVGVVCGLYPMKGLPIRYVLNTAPNPRKVGSLFEVSTSGTGFMLIKREVIEKLVAAMPETKYKDSLSLGEQYEPHMYALFDTMIDENGHYLSEDWTFCKRVREVLKTPIWVDTLIKLDHAGTYVFNGDVEQINTLANEWLKIKEPDADAQLKAYEESNGTDDGQTKPEK